MENMINEKATEVRIDSALRMIKDGELPLEKIALYSGLLVDEVKQLAAITETIRICKDKNVLREYLEEREKEVISIVMNSFDEEQVMDSFIKGEMHNLAREKAVLLLKNGKITIDEVNVYFSELLESDIEELEDEIMA